jgi:opacity protein-like surface antigen
MNNRIAHVASCATMRKKAAPMIKQLWMTGMAALVAAGAAGTAKAADLDRIIYAPELNRTVPVEIGNGWYLRGDIGYSVDTSSDRAFDDWRLDSDFSGGLGVGYQFTDFLRADVTADYTEGDVDGRFAGDINPFSSDFRAYTLLANAYVDLGTFVGFTPYVGAGAGGTYVDYAPYFSAGLETPGGADWRSPTL